MITFGLNYDVKQEGVEEFEKIVEEYIPIDITKNKEYLQSIFSKLDRLLSDFGLDSVNKYVELALFEIV